jgi:hypothetical protein
MRLGKFSKAEIKTVSSLSFIKPILKKLSDIRIEKVSPEVKAKT